MTELDLTLSNSKIRNFLEGSSEIIPDGELMYTHTHFVEKNFLSEIEVLINQAAEVLTKTRSKDHLAMKLYTHAFDYAKLMNQVDEKSAPEIMKCLRQIYQVCKEILK